ncbi:hypothetical protein E4U43_007806 [Claviceps pusilla]|uniref:Amidohydrolase 3 domain-containing protein n=1 Tax=Claviceps pusilla TaxID=123648 RepID=A0A9P7NC03_9HYPO|nr:hypothetical protein E4U43_007806 [Claviceps pusilla]
MFLAPLLRWASFLSISLAVAVAFALAAYPEPRSFAASSSSSSSHFRSVANASTYCYRGIRTHDQDNPAAQCFTVVDGTFARVWTDLHIEETLESSSAFSSSSSSFRNDSAGKTDLLDGYVIPGLWDGHGHLMAWGEFLHSVDLFNVNTISKVRDRLKAYLRANPASGTKTFWLRGTGWDQDLYDRMPTAQDLEQDPALRGVFVMLDRIDGHCIWVSQAVLDILPQNLTSMPTDPPGGQIIRDPGPGVFCDDAMDPVMKLWPKTNEETQTRLVRDAMRDLNRVGLVGVHDASTRPDEIKLYNKLADGQDWTVRVYSMLECATTNAYCPQNATRIARSDSRFWVQSVKLFADGALGSWGSAMLQPYADKPNSTGSLLLNTTTMTNLAKSWAQAGFQVNVHAIGDGANRQVIDAMIAALIHVCPEAQVQPHVPSSSPSSSNLNYEALRICQVKHRFRIEHAQIVHPADQQRMHKVGLIPSIQPTHPTDDMRFAQHRLGPYRTASSAYRMRSYLPLNPLLGSDFPVEPPNPFHGIYAAVTRKNPATGLGLNASHQGWHQEETLTLGQALWGFTGATAYGAFLDGRAGLIREGAFADWVVLDKPIEDTPLEELRTLKVRETWVAGKKVYKREQE